MTENTATAAPTKKATKKAATNGKAKVVKKGTKKTAKAKSSPMKGSRGPTVRERALQALKKKGPMTAGQISEAIGLDHNLKPTMDQEVERGHLRNAPSEKGNIAMYELTAAGRKALENGTVNPPRKGK